MSVFLVVIEIVILGRLAWCISNGAQILFVEEPSNTTFDSFETRNNDESFTINTVGCVIPAIDIEDESIKQYINETRNKTKLCKNYKHRLLGSNQTHIWTIKENYKHFRIHNGSNFVCCYKSFHRPLLTRGISRNIADIRVHYLGCIMFHDIIEVNNEFVKVRCFYKTRSIYSQYFIFTPKKQFTFNRENPFKIPSNQTAYNVIIMGLGSMSRQNLYRTMPKTIELLRNYNAVELKGYNTVAQDTFQNMIPVLVGMNRTELYNTCWPHAQTTLDSCPFIWERFKDLGYYTALVEDTGKFGMFNQGKFGFRGIPTDYYAHPFMHESETWNRRKRNKTKVHKLQKYVSMLPDKEPDRVSTCMGDTYYFEVLLNYIEGITTTLKNSRLFGFFWETSMSHDYLNDPVKMDNGYVTLIKKFQSTGYLNDTIVILLSDHGMDMGDINLTKQGRIEQRLPFLFILMPPSFKKEYGLAYHNLKVNKGRLTSPFDVHKTLIDLIDFTEITDKKILSRSTEFYTHNRGISLFLQIPRNRTCEMAGINTLWCSCYSDVKLSPQNPILIDAIKFLTKHVNHVLLPHPECLRLIVDDIIVAKEMVTVYERSYEWRDYNVIVRMAPGSGIFEAMIRFYNNTWSIIDRIKRLNFPGFRSLCVRDPNVRLFCFCK